MRLDLPVLLLLTAASSRPGPGFAPNATARWVPAGFSSVVANVEEGRARFAQFALAAQLVSCKGSPRQHSRSGFGSYLRLVSHEAAVSLTRGTSPEPLLLPASVTASKSWPAQFNATPECAAGYLSGCFFTSAFTAPSLSLGKCVDSAAAVIHAAKRLKRGMLPARREIEPLARHEVDEWRNYTGREPFWSSVATFAGVLQPTPALQRHLDERLKLCGLLSPSSGGLKAAPARPWISLHLRRGDSCRDAVFMGRVCSTGDDYAKEVAALGRKYKAGALLVATDSDAAFAELEKALPAFGWPVEAPVVLTAGTTTTTAHTLSRRDALRESSRIEDLIDRGDVDAFEEFHAVLMDLLMLAQGDVFVGKFTSNIDRLAYALLVHRSEKAAPYVSLDTAWSKDTPSLFDPRVHGLLIEKMKLQGEQPHHRNQTQKKLRQDECATNRTEPGWSKARNSMWWCPATTGFNTTTTTTTTTPREEGSEQPGPEGPGWKSGDK